MYEVILIKIDIASILYINTSILLNLLTLTRRLTDYCLDDILYVLSHIVLKRHLFKFSINSEANASEFLESIEDVLHCC